MASLFDPGRIWPNIRRTARRVVLGPSSFTVDLPEGRENDFFYGWQVLVLETLVARLEDYEQHEVRAVYANWGWDQMPMMPFAVVRAAYWSRELQSAAVEDIKRAGELISISIPARFARLPLVQVRAWVAGFERLLVPVGDPEGDDDELPIRRLKFDLGWIDQMTEKRWRSRDDAHAPLNAYWERVWAEMTTVLDAAPDIADLSMIPEQESWSQDEILHPFHYSAVDYDPRSVNIDHIVR
jgi:hypothetical protein